MSHERLGNSPSSSANHQSQWQQLQAEKPAQTTDVPERPIAAPEVIEGASLIPPEQASKHIKDQLRAGASLYKLERGGTIKINVPEDPRISAGYIGETDVSCRHVADIYLVDTPGEEQIKLEVVDLRGDSTRQSRFGLYLRGKSQEQSYIEKLQLDTSPVQKHYLGREASRDFAMSKCVSGTHFSVNYVPDWTNRNHFAGGKIVITDENSMNGTLVACNPGQLASEVSTNKYAVAQDAWMTPLANRYWKNKDVGDIDGKNFSDYETISRDTDGVNGKLHLSPDVQESTLVDADAPAIQELYSRLHRSYLVQSKGRKWLGEKIGEIDILRQVLETTQKALRYDLEETDKVCEPYKDSDQIMPLSRMVEAGVGVCRHQALLAASLIESLREDESLRKDGVLQGRVGVERNCNYNRDKDDLSGHQWAVYRVNDNHDDDIIIDPAHGLVEKRSNLIKGEGGHGEYTWDYTIPRQQ